MRRGLKLRNYKIAKLENSARGYMLITLMLVVALMAIAMLAVLPSIKQQAQRDREEELQHRGTAYMRAIQHFYKAFGRYPTRVEDLESTNNLRFLRKRYTDPMNRDAQGKEKDFKFLHPQDVNLNSGPVLNLNPGQNPTGAANGLAQNAQSAFGGSPQSMLGQQGLFGGSGFGGSNQPNVNAANQTSENGDSSSGSEAGGNSGQGGSSAGLPSSSGLNGPTFGGGPIVGVASLNKKDKSIRVFFQKNHYNDWLFIYVPGAETVGLLRGPINPSMPTGNISGAVPVGAMNGGQNTGTGLQPSGSGLNSNPLGGGNPQQPVQNQNSPNQ